MEGFLKGLSDSLKVPPKCIERITCCFDYSILEKSFDTCFARFNLHEKTGDKCHYFVFWNDESTGSVMQYKLLRYSDAIYPRRFMEGQEHDFEGKIGKIVFTTPVKDPVTKEKFWQTKVAFKNDDGTERTEMFKDSAQLHAIKIFYSTLDSPLPTEKDFNVAQFYEKFDADKRAELKADIDGMVQKCHLDEAERTSWINLLSSIPAQASLVENVATFALPLPQIGSCFRVNRSRDLPIDNGVRAVDVVTHRKFTATSRQKLLKMQDQERDEKLLALKKGDFVVLQLGVTNCVQYPFSFVVAQVIEDVSSKDTTNAETLIHFQIFRPSTLNNLSSKMVPWIGDTKLPWKDDFARGLVKAIVQLQPQGRKLTATSRKMIENTFF
jgi:hypothetical protein